MDSPVGLDIYNSTIYIASRALAKSQAMGIGVLMLALDPHLSHARDISRQDD